MLKRILTSNSGPWVFILLVFTVVVGLTFFRIVSLDGREEVEMEESGLRVIYPNGGEVVGKNETVRVRYRAKLLNMDVGNENAEQQLYLIRPDGVFEGLIDDIDINKEEIEFAVNKLKYPAGLDVIVESPPPGKYKIMLVVYESEPVVLGSDKPGMVFWSGSDRFDGKDIIREDGSVINLKYVDVSDGVFEIL